MPTRDSKPPVRGGTNRPIPKYRRGEELVFKVNRNLSGVVLDVKTDEDGRVHYLISALFDFDVSEGAVLCRAAEAERLAVKDVLRDKGRRW